MTPNEALAEEFRVLQVVASRLRLQAEQRIGKGSSPLDLARNQHELKHMALTLGVATAHALFAIAQAGAAEDVRTTEATQVHDLPIIIRDLALDLAHDTWERTEAAAEYSEAAE